MAKLRPIALYREFAEGQPDAGERPSIRDWLCGERYPDQGLIARYLRQGVQIAGRGEMASDVLEPTGRRQLSPGLSTDGVYWWLSELEYYVTEYNLWLPAEFVAHARSRGWRVPSSVKMDGDYEW